MKLLITGATGFLGGYLLEYFSHNYPNWEITGSGRNPQKAKILADKGYKLVKGDLSDVSFVKSKLKNFTHVIHCAALSSPWGTYNEFYQANCQATENLLDHTPGLEKFLHVSSASVYFNFSDRFLVKETDELPRHFVNQYAHTKYLSEQIVLNHPSRCQKLIIRPRAIIGANDTVILPRVIRAYEAGRLKMIGQGQTICDFTSIKNLALALELSLLADIRDEYPVINITDDAPKLLWEMLRMTLSLLELEPKLPKLPYSIAYLAALINETYNKYFSSQEPVLTRYGIAVLKYSMTLDISRAKELLGYKPVITTENSIHEFVDSYKALENG